MRSLLIGIFALGMTPVYEPGSIIPKYFVDKTPQGEYRVYDSKENVLAKYIVKPDSSFKSYRVYEARDPFFLLILSKRERLNIEILLGEIRSQ